MAVETAILLLSDLHFGRDLLDTSLNPLLSVPRKLRKVDAAIMRYYANRCVGHSFQCVSGLPLYLPYLLSRLHVAGYEQSKFDQVWLLGDQATHPSPGAYRFLREYVTQPEYKTKDGQGSCYGLWIPRDTVLAVPGNHDKLLQRDLTIYKEEFAEPMALPKIRERGVSVVIRDIKDRKLVVVMVEANVYAAQELDLDTKYRNHLARGSVDETTMFDINEQLKVAQNNLGFDYDRALRVMLIHYAVDLFAVSGWRGMWDDKILPHRCDGLGKLVANLRNDIHLVIHGHLHKPALYRHEGVPVISIPTTTQEGGPNGFYLLKISNGRELSTEYHSWNGNSFVPDPDDTLSKEIATLPM